MKNLTKSRYLENFILPPINQMKIPMLIIHNKTREWNNLFFQGIVIDSLYLKTYLTDKERKSLWNCL